MFPTIHDNIKTLEIVRHDLKEKWLEIKLLFCVLQIYFAIHKCLEMFLLGFPISISDPILTMRLTTILKAQRTWNMMYSKWDKFGYPVTFEWNNADRVTIFDFLHMDSVTNYYNYLLQPVSQWLPSWQ